MWSWAPTSNSVYGNFPLHGRPSTTNAAGMNGAGANNYSNQMPLPAGSYLHPNQQQYSQPEQQQKDYFQSTNTNSYYNGSSSDGSSFGQNLQQQQYYQQPVMLPQNAMTGSTCNQVPDCGDMSQQPTVEYLYGEEAQKVLEQLQASQFQQQNQSRSSPQVATVTPTVRSKRENPPIPAQAPGTGSLNVGDNVQVSAFGTDFTAAQTVPSCVGAGDQSLESAPQSQQAAAVEEKPKPVMHQILLPQQQSDQPQTTGPHFEISQPRPSTQSKGKKGQTQTYKKMQDYNQYYFNSYETPPYVTPQPIQPRVQQQRLQQQLPRPSRKLSNMPTFHLCGRCTKCKMIQGDNSSSGKNSFTFSKPPLGPVRPATSAPMARQTSTTVFPQY